MLELKEIYDYKGGTVLTPKKGFYHNLVVVDVTSLYPSMAVLHNISFDTVNCECCRDNPNAKLCGEINSMFNSDTNRKDMIEYWICKKTEGK